MKAELLKRRSEMLEFYRQGVKISNWAPILAQKYQINEEAIKRDWSRRNKWVHIFVKIDDPFLMAKKIVAENELLMSDAYRLFENSDDPRSTVQLMWLRLKIWKEYVSLMRELGLFQPLKVDYENKALLHKKKLDEERIPYLKADRDREIRKSALSREHDNLPYFD